MKNKRQPNAAFWITILNDLADQILDAVKILKLLFYYARLR